MINFVSGVSCDSAWIQIGRCGSVTFTAVRFSAAAAGCFAFAEAVFFGAAVRAADDLLRVLVFALRSAADFAEDAVFLAADFFLAADAADLRLLEGAFTGVPAAEVRADAVLREASVFREAARADLLDMRSSLPYRFFFVHNYEQW